MTYETIGDKVTMQGGAAASPKNEKGTKMDKSIGDDVTMKQDEGRGGRRAFAPGDVIAGRYVVESILGEGGMGIVYQCLDRVGGVKVAVKCLPPEVSRNRDEMEDIRDNYRLVADLHHPNIAGARTLEMDESTGDYYLVMDLAQGVSLKRWMRRNLNASQDAKLAILRQIAAALDYAHSKRVIHRDMKPENVMVDDDGGVKVLDFGLAAQIRSSQSRTSAAVTSTGGTPGYKSPEQWRGRAQREPADVYSFGVLAYWLFAGELPFDGDDLAVLGHAVLTEPVEPVADLSAHMNAALVKALAKKPEERFASCGEFVEALEGKDFSRVEHVERVDGVGGARRPAEPGGPRPVAAVKGLLAVALIAALAGGAWWLVSGRNGTTGTSGTTGTNVVHVSSVSSVSDVPSSVSPKPVSTPKPIPPKAGPTDADVKAIAVDASTHEELIKGIDDEQGYFKERKDELTQDLARARANREEHLWTEAAQGFTNYVNGCKGLLELNKERQTAKKNKAKAESAQKSAFDVKASQYAEEGWHKASALLKEANDFVDKRFFVDAATKYAVAAKQFGLCVDEAKAKRERLEEARERAMSIESEIVRDIEPELKRFKAEDCAQTMLVDGNNLRKEGNVAISRGDFTEAEGKLKQAKEKLAAAAKDAKDYRVDTPLRCAREHAAASCWQQCIDECDKVLGWDSDNAEAKRLKAEAERHLVPTVKVVATIDGHEVSGAKLNDGNKDFKLPVKWTLDKGKAYGPYRVSYERDGVRYEGTFERVTSEWSGEKRYLVELKRAELRVTNYPDRVNEGFMDIGFIGDSKEQVSINEYGNFVLRFEYMYMDNFFGGIDIRTPPYSETRNNSSMGWPRYDGMCSIPLIDDEGSDFYDKTSGRDRLKAFQYTGSVYGISPARRDNISKQIWGKDKLFSLGGSYARKPGKWNFMEIKVVGSDIEVYLNGQQINKCDLSAFYTNGTTPDKHKHPGLTRRRGHIRFVRFAEGRLIWRNARILQLPDNFSIEDVTPSIPKEYPVGFERYFSGREEDMRMWKGVTTQERFDNPSVRQKASSEKRSAMQAVANMAMRQHWFVRNGSLFFDGFKGGHSIATIKDYADFEMWADWRIMSFGGDSGLYLRGAPQVQIWDAHNQWNLGSGGLYNNRQNPSKALKIADRQIGDWNRFHIIMRGDKVTVWLNGELVVDNVTMENYWDRRRAIFPCEQIELQCHGDPVEWRNIFIKSL